MQRRKAEATPSSLNGAAPIVSPSSSSLSATAGVTTTGTGTGTVTSSRSRMNSNRRSKGGSGTSSGNSNNLLFLLAIVVILITMITFLSPTRVKNDIVKEAIDAEHKVEEFFHHEQVPPVKIDDPEDPDHQAKKDATEAMKRQPSKWVDGEKKLKQKLKVLAERQSNGQDLGVPILTRWLGDDFPAWVAEGQDKEEWEKRRAAEYERMKKEEEQWREKVRKEFLESTSTSTDENNNAVTDEGPNKE